MQSVGRSLIGVLALAALGACGVQTSSGDAPSTTDAADAGSVTQAFGDVVSFDQIAVYQGVKVTLVSGAETLTPNAPVVPKRPALVRVGTKLAPRAKVNKLTATLRVRAPGQPDVVLVNGPRAVTNFEDADLETSFSWELGADQVLPGATLSVEIRDPSGADPTVLRYPADGELSMSVGDFAPKFKVTLVPVKYEADGSNRLPDTDERTIEQYRSALYRMYPVSQVEISVRDPLPWPVEVRGSGEGWNELLDAVMKTRDADDVADDVYYVGVFIPAANQYEYCQNGCILGIAPAQGFGDDVSLRTAMVVGYRSERLYGTLAQELAHAMGRLHAPCGGPTGIDSRYPYSGASIGTWGWDVVDKQLVNPEEYVDFMSYCAPTWVSDYTFGAIYEKMIDVDRTKRPGVGKPERQPMKTYHVGKDGSLRAGPTLRGVPSLTDELVIEGGAHEVLGRVRGSFRAIAGLDGGVFLTPTEIPSATLKRARFAHR